MPVELEVIKFVSKKRSEQRSEIAQFINENEITSLFHFTRVQNIPNIISYGLRSSKDLIGIPHVRSDDDRFDGHLWGSSFSVGSPQMFMLRHKVKNVHFRDYVLLEFCATALLEHDFVAFPGNAASSAVSNYFQDNPYPLGGLEGLRRMFLSTGIREMQQLRKFESTDAQAEVMFLDPVSWSKYFTRIHLQDHYSRDAIDLVAEIENIDSKKVIRSPEFDGKYFLDVRFEFDELTQKRFDTKFTADWVKH